MSVNVTPRTFMNRPARILFRLTAILSLILLQLAGIFQAVPAALAAPVTIVDDGGADDLTGQKDLNFLTVDYTPSSGDILVFWGWDDTNWSGNNTGDACTLFDTDGDGFANYSLCITVGQSGVYQSTSLYICTADNRSDRCAGPTLDPTFNSTGSASVQNVDPFGTAGRAANECSNGGATGCLIKDTVARLSVDIDDVGGGTAKLINVCSYPSKEPNSDPSDCVVTPNSGFLTIVKVANPNDGTPFRFNASAPSAGGVSTWTINGSGSVQLISYAATTTLDLNELVPTGWKLDSASCQLKTGTPVATGTPTSTGVDNFEIRAGLETVCTFNDSPAEGPPSIVVTKTASPISVSEPGGNVTFTVSVQNTSDATDPVTISSLSDDNYGNLDGQGTCDVPQTIQPGQTYTCTFSGPVSGNPGSTHTNVVTASGADNEGTPVSDSDDAVVAITDVPATINVVKMASPTSVNEPGGQVTFTFTVYNTSVVDTVTINSLSDSIYGDLTTEPGSTCTVPQLIPAGQSYTCTLTTSITGNAGSAHTNTVTASGLDDDGQPVSDTDDETVTVNNLPSSIELIKTANPGSVDEPGDDVTFTFEVKNTSAVDAVTISSLSDDKFGNLDGQGTCDLSQTILAGASYTCSVVKQISGNAGYVHTNLATASGTDDDGNPLTASDNATVTINNIPSAIEILKTANPTTVDEPGGTVTFDFVVNNLSTVDTITLDTLFDDVYLDLTQVPGTTCTLPQTIAPSDSYACSISVFVGGNAGFIHTNTVTASGIDDDNQPVSDDDDATVTVNDIQGDIEVVKTASSPSVSEPGDDVTFTIVVNNLSTIDAVTLNLLDDDQFGNLNGLGDCAVPQIIAPNDSYTCSFTEFISGNAGESHTNVVTASGVDDDGQPVSDDDDETVVILDVPSSIELIKTANANSVNEPGGDVTFTFEVKNTSAVDAVTISSLIDDKFGNLDDQGTCDVPQTIAAGQSYTCSVVKAISGNAGYVHTNLATASGTDDDGNPVTASDNEVVTITDVPASIKTTKTASPSSVPETGADVTFTIVVENTSLVDTVTIEEVEDSVFGDVSDSCDPALPAILDPGETTTCTFTEFITGDAGTNHVNVATAKGTDDDGNPVEDDDELTTPFVDVKPDITVTKTANPTSVPETGGNATFTFVVTNNSAEDATITALTDDKFGTLAGDSDCAVGTVLDGGASCSFSASFPIPAGDYPGEHVNTFTATVEDDDNNSASDDDSETVTYTDVLPDITVSKTADPTSVPETGGDVTFTFEVTNNSDEAAEITALSDDQFGALAGDSDCQVGTVLLGGASCSFSATFTIPAGDYPGSHVNTFTATVEDNDGNNDTESDDETVAYTDVEPDITVSKTADPTSVPETGGDVTFTFVVTNNSAEDATITSLSDSVYGTLEGDADCAVDTVLASGQSCTFSITRSVAGDYSGDDHYNVFTAVASDDDGNSDTATDDETVILTDVKPEITVTKTADPTSVPETGGDVTFTFEVTNNSDEAAEITVLTDNQFGPLAGDADCEVGTVLVGGASCSFSASFTIPAGDVPGSHVNTFTATVEDNDGNSDSDSESETVTYTDVLPEITVSKTADPSSVPETGGDVTFTFEVTNNSDEAAEITVLTDNQFGPLAGDSDCQVGTVLAGGASCSFSASFPIPAGDYPGSHVNTFTATVEDDDGNSDSDSESETVTYTDVLPEITVTKTASPSVVPETGGSANFTFVVTNNSDEAATITALTDDKFGTLAGDSDCQVGTVLAGGASCTFSITRSVAGDYESGVSHVNVVTVVATDDDDNTDTATDDATVSFTNVTANIDVEKYVRVNGGAWLDADSPTGPYTTQGSLVEFRFVVTNNTNSGVALSNITLSDSDFSLAGCTIPTMLAAGDSFECIISTTAALGQHANTATAQGSFTDGAGNTESDSDTDNAHYYGLSRGQPSISINSLSIGINSTRTTVSGQFNITDESSSASKPDGFMVALTDYGVRWEQKGSGKNAAFAPVNPSSGCTYTIVSRDGVVYSPALTLAPGEDIIFDETVTIGYSCSFANNQLTRGGTLRGTAYATIFGRPDREFNFRNTASIPR